MPFILVIAPPKSFCFCDIQDMWRLRRASFCWSATKARLPTKGIETMLTVMAFVGWGQYLSLDVAVACQGYKIGFFGRETQSLKHSTIRFCIPSQVVDDKYENDDFYDLSILKAVL